MTRMRYLILVVFAAGCATNPGRGTVSDMRHFKFGLCSSGSSGILIGYANITSCAFGPPRALAFNGRPAESAERSTR